MNRPVAPDRLNRVGMAKADYRGLPSTLCQGCGHNSISNQILSLPVTS
jgi:2-oxoglutarate/2-oxoacid ferredoxin oxidoreductase subunit beta